MPGRGDRGRKMRRAFGRLLLVLAAMAAYTGWSVIGRRADGLPPQARVPFLLGGLIGLLLLVVPALVLIHSARRSDPGEVDEGEMAPVD